jgi:uncharacterized protein (DUF362 family)
MEAGEYHKALNPARRLVIKLNLSWSKFFPACSTNPYTLEAIIKFLLAKGFERERILLTENETVVTDIQKGLRNNGWDRVMGKYGLKFIPLTEAEWTAIDLSRKTLALEELFGEIRVPKFVIGADILHLPTMKTHGHSLMTGALKNAFGLFLGKDRHLAHLRIHEILVDLLLLQKEICGNLFAVTDGTVIGDSAGPRTMIPKIGNILIASRDLVAIDAVQCRIMGIDPYAVKKLQLAEELGLGIASLKRIEIVGDYGNVDELPSHGCVPKQSLVIKYDRLLRSSFIEPLLFRTPLMLLPTLASRIYHDYYWYPLKGKKHVEWFLQKTEWGKLLLRYIEERPP